MLGRKLIDRNQAASIAPFCPVVVPGTSLGAGAIQGLTTVARQFSSLATAGFGNPVLSTAEAGASVGMTLLAIVVPLVAAVGALLMLFVAAKKIFFRSTPQAAA